MSAGQVNLKHPLIKALHQTKAQDEAVAKMVRPLLFCFTASELSSLWLTHKSIGLRYEPSSDPLSISAK